MKTDRRASTRVGRSSVRKVVIIGAGPAGYTAERRIALPAIGDDERSVLNGSGRSARRPPSTDLQVRAGHAVMGSAGDVQDFAWRQAVTAAGTGCIAALEAERHLEATQAG